jgi:hypothetical protein
MFRDFGLLGTIAAAVSATAVVSEAAPTSVTLTPPDLARQVVIGCGLPEKRVSVSYERDMQEDVVWIAHGQSNLPEHMLACVARASLQTIYYVYFRDAGEQDRYWPIYAKLRNEKEVGEAREWLAERNRLSALPLSEKGRLSDYVKAVEKFCGVLPGSLLVAQGDDFITFTEDGLGRVTNNGVEGAAASDEQFECVTRVISAGDLRAKGIGFGFLGNAAANVR